MRFIDRASEPKPSILSGPEMLKAKAMIGEHYKLPWHVREGRRVPTEAKIWLDDSVRRSLHSMCHGKCAYCEAPLPTGSAEVHHYRPLANAQNPTRKQQSPDHYGWFAYEWRNLLYVCASCSRAKANLFPVNGLRAPVLYSWDDAQRIERCELLDPCSVQPWQHLTFSWDGRVSGKTSAGRTTISILNLNRLELVEERHHLFCECLQTIQAFQRLTPDNRSVGHSRLHDILSTEAPFSGGANILLYDTVRDVAKTAGIPMPNRARLGSSIEVLLRSFGETEWQRLDQFVRERNEAAISSQLYLEVPEEDMRASSYLTSLQRRRTSSAQIRHVHIKDFKGISDLLLTFPESRSNDPGAPCAMLLGENSTGKSSVLQAIALGLMGETLRKKLRLKPEDYLPREVENWQYLGTRKAQITVEFDSSPPVKLEIDPAKAEFACDSDSEMILLAYGARRYFGQPLKRLNPVSGVRSLFDPLATLNHPERWLERLDRSEFAAVSRATREILALRPEDNIERDDDGRVFVKAHGRDTPLDHLSEGYRTLFTMAIDVMREMISHWGNLEEARGVVLIDEIETHLHPRWKMQVVSALRKAMPNVQFIATTHDPLCLRGMRNGEVHVLIRNGRNEVEELLDLPDVRGLRSEQLLTSDYFGLASTSDPDIEAGLEELAILIGSGKSDPSSLARARERILPLTLIGDTQQEQIINEAMKRFLQEHRNASAVERSAIRERAVNEVLERLRNPAMSRS